MRHGKTSLFLDESDGTSNIETTQYDPGPGASLRILVVLILLKRYLDEEATLTLVLTSSV